MAMERHSTSGRTLSRREVLKALGIIGGATAASALLPEKWVKPVVEAGVVPAHAQSSIICEMPYSIVSCDIIEYSWVDNDNFDFSITVKVDPPCPNVPMIWDLEILDSNLVLIAYFGFDSHVAINTEPFGVVVHKVSNLFRGSTNPYLFTVTWKFNDSNYGAETCTSTLISPPRP
jgi:hypothetical protein